jgi:hypothetical protein
MICVGNSGDGAHPRERPAQAARLRFRPLVLLSRDSLYSDGGRRRHSSVEELDVLEAFVR